MDIVVRLSPRRIERAIFILIITALVISNIYFYNKQSSKQTETTGSTEEENTQTPETQEQTTEPKPKQEIKQNTTQTNTTQKTGSCTEGWKCKTPYYKGQQKSDCSWEGLEACVNGCINGQCNVTTS